VKEVAETRLNMILTGFYSVGLARTLYLDDWGKAYVVVVLKSDIAS
jgi:hypothetical protein